MNGEIFHICRLPLSLSHTNCMIVSNGSVMVCANPLRFRSWSSDVVGRDLEVTIEKVSIKVEWMN
jgi:hypothetical protein